MAEFGEGGPGEQGSRWQAQREQGRWPGETRAEWEVRQRPANVEPLVVELSQEAARAEARRQEEQRRQEQEGPKPLVVELPQEAARAEARRQEEQRRQEQANPEPQPGPNAPDNHGDGGGPGGHGGGHEGGHGHGPEYPVTPEIMLRRQVQKIEQELSWLRGTNKPYAEAVSIGAELITSEQEALYQELCRQYDVDTEEHKPLHVHAFKRDRPRNAVEPSRSFGRMLPPFTWITEIPRQLYESGARLGEMTQQHKVKWEMYATKDPNIAFMERRVWTGELDDKGNDVPGPILSAEAVYVGDGVFQERQQQLVGSKTKDVWKELSEDVARDGKEGKDWRINPKLEKWMKSADYRLKRAALASVPNWSADESEHELASIMAGSKAAYDEGEGPVRMKELPGEGSRRNEAIPVMPGEEKVDISHVLPEPQGRKARVPGARRPQVNVPPPSRPPKRPDVARPRPGRTERERVEQEAFAAQMRDFEARRAQWERARRRAEGMPDSGTGAGGVEPPVRAEAERSDDPPGGGDGPKPPDALPRSEQGPERGERLETVADRVVAAARNGTRIFTHVPSGKELRRGEHDDIAWQIGIQEFGDGSVTFEGGEMEGGGAPLLNRIGDSMGMQVVGPIPSHITEMVAFQPGSGDREGQTLWEYAYNPRLAGEEAEQERQMYQRPGSNYPNLLVTRAWLPEAVANELRQEIMQLQGEDAKDNGKRAEALVRETVGRLVMERGGIRSELWYGSAAVPSSARPAVPPMRPPFESIDRNPDHRLFMAQPAYNPFDENEKRWTLQALGAPLPPDAPPPDAPPRPRPRPEPEPRPEARRPGPEQEPQRPPRPDRPDQPRRPGRGGGGEIPPNSPESRERLEAIENEVLRLAENHTVIHTDLVPNLKVRVHGTESDGRPRVRKTHWGYQTFGDGAGSAGLSSINTPLYFHTAMGKNTGDSIQTRDGYLPPDMVEAVGFVRAMRDVEKDVEVRDVKKKRLGKDIVTVRTVKQKTGEQEEVLIRNTDTGDDEPMVYFDYAFNPRLQGESSKIAQDINYRETLGHRGGNLLTVRVGLPKSTADDLRDELGRLETMDVKDNGERVKTLVRKIVERLVLERGGVPRSAWENSGGEVEQINPIRPPFGKADEVSSNMYLVEDDGKSEGGAHYRRLRKLGAAA